MQAPFRILERSPEEALQRYLQQANVRLPHDFLTQALQMIVQALMDIEVSAMIDASRYERNQIRRAYRNGYRDSAWLSKSGNIPLRIPKLRSGTYYPSFLEDYCAEALISRLTFSAYMNRLSFEQLASSIEELGIDAHPSEIASLHELLYDLRETFRENLLNKRRIYLDLLPVDEDGKTRYLALAFDDKELIEQETTSYADEKFWQDFIRRLDQRSVQGVEYITVGQIRHIVRLNTSSKPSMCLAA